MTVPIEEVAALQQVLAVIDVDLSGDDPPAPREQRLLVGHPGRGITERVLERGVEAAAGGLADMVVVDPLIAEGPGPRRHLSQVTAIAQQVTGLLNLPLDLRLDIFAKKLGHARHPVSP
jgi:hypothetical protein